jgi:Helix-turn-helix.
MCKGGFPSDGYSFARLFDYLHTFGCKYTNYFHTTIRLVRICADYYIILTDLRGFMRLRNNIFAEAFDYLKREKGIKTQKRLAELMGVSEDTITRILKDRTEVTEDIITKLQTASGCIFNLQWLRGEDDEPMLAADISNKNMHQSASIIDPGSAVNAALAAKDETIETLKARIVELKSTIADKEDMIKARDARIVDLEQKLAKIQISDLDNYPFSIGAAEERQKRKNI